jgi:hypothetical protein
MSPARKFNFRPFEESSKRAGSSPRATITKYGNINLNNKFKDENWTMIKGCHVIFHYDPESRVIGLQVVANPAHNSYPIRELEAGKGLVVTARAFLKHSGIPFTKSSSYDIKLYDTRDSLPFFYVDLRQAGAD